jgi:hypothetical protein
MPEIGAAVTAIERCVEVAEQVKGYDLRFDASALEKDAADLEKVRS